jgi:glycosyltransferase involved in cell wall biosynthesis
MRTTIPHPTVAVVIPCHNEEVAIAKVIGDFRAALPEARLVVVDNASTDATVAQAQRAGAEVISESRRGKGHALLRGFDHVRGAEYVVMVDGDDTYPAEEAARLLSAAQQGADMVVGTRLHTHDAMAFRRGHAWGNRAFLLLVRALFGVRTRDLFSGFRVLTRRFVERSPFIASGFEIETELVLHAAVGDFVVTEVPVHYRARPADSQSKLNTVRDGYRIAVAMVAFLRDYRPLTFFGSLSAAFFSASVVFGAVVVRQYLETGLVGRLPMAVLSTGLMVLAALSAMAGVILSSINRRASEIAALIARRA